MRNRVSTVLLMGIVLLCTVPAQAATFWEETFETTTMPAWVTSVCVGDIPNCFTTKGIGPTNLAKVNGTYSFGEAYDGTGAHGGIYDRGYTATSEIYWRNWERLDVTLDTLQQAKGFNLGTIGVYPNYWIMHAFGSRTLTIDGQAVAEACPSTGLPHGNNLPYDSCRYDDNIVVTPLSAGRWYCQEGHIKNNTRGIADGIIERWTDGVLVMRYTNRTFIGPNDVNGSSGAPNSGLMQFSNVRLYLQGIAGVGNKYYDDLAVGTTRIGCGVAPPGDTTPPATPIGLAVH